MKGNTEGNRYEKAFRSDHLLTVTFTNSEANGINNVVLNTESGDSFDVTLMSDVAAASGKETIKINGTSEGSEVEVGLSGSDIILNNCTNVSVTINDSPVENLEELGKNINFYDISLEYTEAKYTGKAVKPGIKVKGHDLKEGTDYTISYKNNTGSPTEDVSAEAIIEGKGEYSGKKTLKFTIGPERKVKSAKIGKIKDQAYTGKALKPELNITYKGQELVQGKDYTVSWKNNKKIGTATVTVTGKGFYIGKKTATFKIVPKAVKFTTMKVGKKQMTLRWSKGKSIDGYEIEYGLKKNFKKAKKITIRSAKIAKTIVRGLKAKKTYYARIRAFKTVKGKKYYSAWSKVEKAKVK